MDFRSMRSLMLLCGVPAGCGNHGGNSTKGTDSGASVSNSSDSGSYESAPQFTEGCPPGPFPSSHLAELDEIWRPAMHPVVGGEGALFIESELLSLPVEWGSSAFGVWDGLTLAAASPDMLVSDYAGHVGFRMTPVDSVGQRGDSIVCDIEFVHVEELVVEMGTNPEYIGERELHFVEVGGALYDEESDVCKCNQWVYDTDAEEDELDYIVTWEWPGNRPEWPMSQEEGIVLSPKPGPFQRTVQVLDTGDNMEEEPGVPYESEIRVWLDGVMVHQSRARIPAGHVWTVGVVDTETRTFTPAEPDDVQRYSGPTECF
jgi:hypothetical protein